PALLLIIFLCAGGCSSKEGAQENNFSDVDAGVDAVGGDSDADTPPPDAIGVSDSGEVDTGEEPPVIVDVPFGIEERPLNTSCVGWERPETGSSILLEHVFARLSFSLPLWMEQAPGAPDRWYVIEQAGRIRTFENRDDVAETTDFVDLRQRVQSGGERGLLGMAFDPGFQENGRVFLSYTALRDSQLVSRLSRFRSDDGGLTLDPSSEVVLLSIDQDFGNHNGGQISFGPDGNLYVAMGDGGSGGDPNGHGQNPHTLLGTILRVNVDGEGYENPSDNPFVNGGGRPEIYAWGLRNPWRFSFDRESGELWAADVGQNAREEVNIIQRGGNYGWNAKEGFSCYAVTPCDDGTWIDPVYDYGHQNNDKSVTGGYVYRGSAIPDLIGTYVFGDYISGRIWGLTFDVETGRPQRELLASPGMNVSSFAQDHDGELYAINYGGTLHRITQAGEPRQSTVPPRLSETGCVDALDPRLPASAMIAYRVNAPLWSDGLDKDRFFALPNGETIEIDDEGRWILPIGSVVMKSFVHEDRHVETRFLIHHEDGRWSGYTYEWNEAQTDAVLLPSSKRVTLSDRQWYIPSRSDCTSCHTQAAGFTLGLETAQLDGTMIYAGHRRAHQLETLEHIDVFARPVEERPPLAEYDGPASAAARARAYLHANCAGCHLPGGPTPSTMDMRYDVPLQEMDLCDIPPNGTTLGLDEPRLLAPGDATGSLLSARMQVLDAYRMPPLGTHLVDDEGVALIETWINALTGCSDE
ncbi:MAG: PQQ-dependent sugar dehydrogenase, partial [Bradymonadaceae bacterium]